MWPGRSQVIGTLALGFSIVACGESSDPSADWRDSSPHVSAFVELDGVRLNYLDWGGGGRALVLLAGLTNSPHIYDELAPTFADQFRVVALARRGHGRSGGGDGPVDIDVLVEDIRGWLDELGLERVVLVGHSMAGNEITRFAALYPDRVDQLIYLDATYDYSTETYQDVFANYPGDFTLTDEDIASLTAIRNYAQRALWPDILWTDALEAEVREMAELARDGRMIFADSAMTGRWLASLQGYAREYSLVQAPALAIVSRFYEGAIIPPDASDSQRAAVQAWIAERALPWQLNNTERFLREVSTSDVLELDEANHYVFVHHADTVVAVMHAFLSENRE